MSIYFPRWWSSGDALWYISNRWPHRNWHWRWEPQYFSNLVIGVEL